jgi:8-oxo-dGTP pyrophosphatase MutT (NUDIX family)
MKTKKEVSAGGIVYKKEKGQTLWLVTQHSWHKGWVFPKGLIGDKEKNEPMEQAALREVEEEGGVKAKIVDPAPAETEYSYRWKGSPHGKDAAEEFLVHKKVYYYLMEYLSGDPKNHDWEMMDAKFAGADEVKKLLTYPADLKAFEELLARFKKGTE